MVTRLRAIVVVAWCVVPWLLFGQPESAERYPQSFLKQQLGFTNVELRLVEVGLPVVKELDTRLKREIAIFGIIWIETDPEAFVASFRDIEQFERGAGVLVTKKISDPPSLADFEAMTLSKDDLRALRTCRIGDCLVKVDAQSLARFQKEVDWNARDSAAQANALARQLLLETLLAYQQGGNGSLGQLRDQERPTFIGEEFLGILEGAPYLPMYAPALYDYLKNYPSGRPPDAEEFFYWSDVNFGLRDTVRLNHVVVYRNPSAPGNVVIASKMLYATHYFYTALDLRYLARDTSRPDARGFYLMTLLRSRSDGMTGFFGGMVRRRAVKGSVDGLTKHLEVVKRRLEATSGADGGGGVDKAPAVR
jgi:hypothetical protein